MSNKVLFMDIDGVVCNNNVGREDWDPVAVIMLKRAILETGVKVVISSTWRTVAHDLMMQRLRDFGMENLLHEDYITPDFRDSFGRYCRSDEIDQWLKDHPEVEEFVIVDDDLSRFDKRHFDRLVKTNFGKGFQHKDYKKVLAMMKTDR